MAEFFQVVFFGTLTYLILRAVLHFALPVWRDMDSMQQSKLCHWVFNYGLGSAAFGGLLMWGDWGWIPAFAILIFLAVMEYRAWHDD